MLHMPAEVNGLHNLEMHYAQAYFTVPVCVRYWKDECDSCCLSLKAFKKLYFSGNGKQEGREYKKVFPL